MSQEAEIDRQIEGLIAKMVAGKATEEDKRAYRELSERRAARMQAPIRRGDRRRVKVA
jgi:hypothetical protein